MTAARADRSATAPRGAVAGCAYFGVRIARHVERDLDDLVDRGFGGVLHTFSENDLAYYRGTMREIVEFVSSLYRGDRYRLVAELSQRRDRPVTLQPALAVVAGDRDGA